MSMQRVVILGRGGAGKSTVARRLGEVLGLPVIELDKHFWQPGLVPLPKDQWVRVQLELANQPRWVMDGDLGPYDVLPVRLSAADAVLLLDFPMWLCLWRTLRRGKERWDFWWRLITWRWLERPKIRGLLAEHPSVEVHAFQSPKELDQFLSKFAPA
jgi:adenylate kinase family enzyme